MRSLRVLLSDRGTAGAIAALAAILLLFQAIAGNAAEVARATGNGGIVLCSAAAAVDQTGSDQGKRGTALCSECCAVCHLTHSLALLPPDMPHGAPPRLAARPIARPEARAPPLHTLRNRNAPTRGPPIFS
ncbi:DUF2946 domain-containing protein [Jiella endophytica]|uniref:DUF2946 domain-containing protein n=1 Tax=Jiella endophytica TaxID=2558362 RepID=A0A4Y8R9N5_9HYPH|nr:DUF2946 domain-containing protein [Jiella endophytica]